MTESILETAKKLCNGIPPEDTDFDDDILRAVNLEFVTLRQLNDACPINFSIRDATSKWSDWSDDVSLVALAAEYIANRVKLLFDPPQSSTGIDLIKSIVDETAWRITIYKKEES